MKITNIRTFVTDCFRCNFDFIKIETDEGIYGVGEGTLEYKDNALLGAVEDIKNELIGKNPLNIDDIIYHLYRDSYWRKGPVLNSAISMIEMALWDIKGKYHGVPVMDLLGGRCREEIRMYANGWFAGSKKPEEFAAKAKAAKEKGVTALKWDPFGKAYLNLSRQEMVEAIDCVAAVRDAVGNDMDLLIECHGRFNVSTGIQICREMAPFKPMFVEEPLPPDDLDGLAEVHRKSPVPLAAGERIFSIYECKEFMEKGCADFFQPDISHCGGISALKKMAAMADTHYVTMAPHNPSGPIANAATLQLAGNLHNFHILEIMLTDVDWRSELTTEEVVFNKGYIRIPTKPGLGLDICEEGIARHPYVPVRLRHYNGTLTDIRPKSATKFYFKGIE